MGLTQTRDEQLLNNATITTSGSSSVITNDGRTEWVLDVRIANAPTGTTPSITFAVTVSNDGINFIQAGAALTALTAAGSQRTEYTISSTQGPIEEDFIKVTWNVTGTTPSFTGVFADLVGL